MEGLLSFGSLNVTSTAFKGLGSGGLEGASLNFSSPRSSVDWRAHVFRMMSNVSAQVLDVGESNAKMEVSWQLFFTQCL